jgi:hypothetical protein
MLKWNWDYNPSCHFCLCMPETSDHLFSQCNYTKATWNRIAPKLGFCNFSAILSPNGMRDWTTYFLSSSPNTQKKGKLGMLFIFWWQV